MKIQSQKFFAMCGLFCMVMMVACTSALAQEKEAKDDKEQIAKAVKAITGNWKADADATEKYLDGLEDISDEMRERALEFCEEGINLEFTKDMKMSVKESDVGEGESMGYEISKVASKKMKTEIQAAVSRGDDKQKFTILVLSKDSIAISPPGDNDPPLVFSRVKENR